jgi:tetratricopeptide (TPR) repeat protein
MGDLEKAAEWLEKAYECPDHSNMAARNLAHIYESLPDFDKALYWYYVAAEDDPTHPTPPGAVMTIRERYLPAWRAYTNGDLELAKKLIENTLEDYQPAGRIALHFLTTILEAQARQAEAQGKRSEAEKIYKEAINKWEFCFALDKMDSMALRKAYELREKMGIPQPSDKELEDKWWSVETSFR